MKKTKGCYPWRVGATSFVLPAGVEENVCFLADKVDDIQLLFFESQSHSLLPHHVDVPLLGDKAIEHDLSYTVHLPLDIRAGSNSVRIRQNGCTEIAGLFEELLPLNPLFFDLHLVREPQITREQWRDNVGDFLVLLRKELGAESSRVAIENVDYPFCDIRDLVLDYGFSFCLDFGHALFYDDNPEKLLKDISRAAHIHYHGIQNMKDHQALGKTQSDFTKRLASELLACNYSGVVTLELYSEEKLRHSLEQLEVDWLDFTKKEKCTNIKRK